VAEQRGDSGEVTHVAVGSKKPVGKDRGGGVLIKMGVEEGKLSFHVSAKIKTSTKAVWGG